MGPHAFNVYITYLAADIYVQEYAKTFCVAFLSLFFQSVDCGPPPQITNGTVIGGFFTSVGSVASYLCEFPTNLVGNDTIDCEYMN